MRAVRTILTIFTILTLSSVQAQNYSFKKKFGTQQNAMYFYWGYNRSIYTKSDINFYGPGYDFVLKNAAAHDRPEGDIKKYFTEPSIPQFNIRIGWYYKHRWDWSIGYDHMKYVMRANQTLIINGDIFSTTNSTLNGSYTNASGAIPILPEDLHYENTNGLNFISVRLNNTAPIYKSNNRAFAVQRRLGGGFGPVITQTDFNWDGDTYSYDVNSLKLAGYGISLNGGVRFDFFNRFFLMSVWDVGYIHLPKNATIQFQEHYAKQDFIFGEWQLVGGFLWYLRTKNGCDTCPDWH